MSQPSIKKNFAYKSILTLSTYLINFITFPYVARVLGVERIGLVNFVDNTVNYFLLFATMGVGLLGVREIAAVKEDKKRRDQVYSNVLALNLLFTLVSLGIYLLCVVTIPKLCQYDELFYIGTAKILFTVFLVEWFFTGVENFRYITLRSILIKVLYIISVFLFVRDTSDYRLYFILTVGVVVLNALINQLYIRKFVRVRWNNIQLFKYLKQNVTLGIYTLMTSMYLTFNVMYLGLVSNNTEVGYYTTAFKLYSVILGFFTAFTNVMLPRMSSLLANGEKDRFQELVNRSFSVMATCCIPLILCSMIMAPQIVYILSGPGYEGAILPMRIIMPAAFAVGVAQVLAIHTLLLSKWNPAFAWLPVESIIHDRQQEYYEAINASNNAGESTVFIEFMLSAIKASLMDAINTSDEMSDGAMDKATVRWRQIEKFLETHEFIMNADVRALCGVSAATANRVLAGLTAERKLVKYSRNGHWAYKLVY